MHKDKKFKPSLNFSPKVYLISILNLTVTMVFQKKYRVYMLTILNVEK